MITKKKNVLVSLLVYQKWGPIYQNQFRSEKSGWCISRFNVPVIDHGPVTIGLLGKNVFPFNVKNYEASEETQV